MLPLLGRLRLVFKRPEQDVRNGGIEACMQIWGIDKRKFSEFSNTLTSDVRQQTEADILAVFECANEFLWSGPSEQRWDMEVFLPALRKKLAAQFPWLSDRAFRSIAGYCHWMAWHEGL
ncbi:MAG: hypothetical protein WCC57_05445 [Paracoccaceae bacterium]